MIHLCRLSSRPFRATFLLIFLSVVWMVSGCKSPSEPNPAPVPVPSRSDQKAITSFAFLKADNPVLLRDYPVSFQNANGLVTLFTGTDVTALKPSFSVSPKAAVTVSGYRQESGVTPANFNNPVTYKVTAEDGSTAEYTVEVSIQRDLPQVDDRVTAFMSRYSLPGVSLAVTKGERLVYSKGYGFTSLEEKTPVNTNSRFRICSLSKSITAMAVLKLVEEGKLKLDQTVLGANGLLGTAFGTPPYRKGTEQITVRHLLQHLSGGDWSNQGWEPMWVDPYHNWYPWNFPQSAIISNAINSREMVATPGAQYSYSNLGYVLLGRVIEKVTGRSYEEYTKETILMKAGSEGMVIGSDLPNEKVPGEATFYRPLEERSYGPPIHFPARRFDSSGGWLASSAMLARVLVRVDGFSQKEDFLPPTLLKEMTTPTAASGNSYAMGWNVNAFNNYWHTGSWDGAKAIWVRYANGLTFTLLTNSGPNSDPFYQDLFRLANEVTGMGDPLFMKGDQFN